MADYKVLADRVVADQRKFNVPYQLLQYVVVCIHVHTYIILNKIVHLLMNLMAANFGCHSLLYECTVHTVPIPHLIVQTITFDNEN